jgi:hypothetical protein
MPPVEITLWRANYIKDVMMRHTAFRGRRAWLHRQKSEDRPVFDALILHFPWLLVETVEPQPVIILPDRTTVRHLCIARSLGMLCLDHDFGERLFTPKIKRTTKRKRDE